MFDRSIYYLDNVRFLWKVIFVEGEFVIKGNYK